MADAKNTWISVIVLPKPVRVTFRWLRRHVTWIACGASAFAGAALVVLALHWPAFGGALIGDRNPERVKAVLDTASALVTALATMGLVIVAIFGLQQLRLAKHDLRIRSRREARSITIAQCERFATEIIVPHNEISNDLAAAGRPAFDLTGIPVDFDASNKTAVARAQQWIVGMPPELQGRTITLLNTLETWSMNFTLRIADSEAAYAPASNVFCKVVLQLYPMILALRFAQDPDLFPNVTTLFRDWEARKTVQTALRQQEQLERRMQTFRLMRARMPPHPDPLGDED